GGIPATQVILAFAGAKQGSTTRFFAITKSAGSVYAGIEGWDTGAGQAVYSLDYGQPNWTPRTAGIPAGVYPFYVAMARNNINVAYVAGGGSSGAPTVYKTANGGGSWQNVFVTANNQNIQTGWSGAGGDRSWGYGELALGFTVAGNDANRLVITGHGFAPLSPPAGARS